MPGPGPGGREIPPPKPPPPPLLVLSAAAPLPVPPRCRLSGLGPYMGKERRGACVRERNRMSEQRRSVDRSTTSFWRVLKCRGKKYYEASKKCEISALI